MEQTKVAHLAGAKVIRSLTSLSSVVLISVFQKPSLGPLILFLTTGQILNVLVQYSSQVQIQSNLNNDPVASWMRSFVISLILIAILMLVAIFLDLPFPPVMLIVFLVFSLFQPLDTLVMYTRGSRFYLFFVLVYSILGLTAKLFWLLLVHGNIWTFALIDSALFALIVAFIFRMEIKLTFSVVRNLLVLKSVLKDYRNFYLKSIFSIGINKADHLMINALLSTESLGVYGLTYRIYDSVNQLQVVFQQYFTLNFYDDIKLNYGFPWLKFGPIIRYLLLFLILVSGIIFCLPLEFFENLSISRLSLVVLLVTVPINVRLSYDILRCNINKQGLPLIRTYMVVGVFNILSNLVLIPLLGIIGSSICTLISSVLIALLLIYLNPTKIKVQSVIED